MADVVAMDGWVLAFLADARRATLATAGPGGRPRLVPICFVVLPRAQRDDVAVYSPIDEKPKADADPLALARVRDIVERPQATILVDRWSEDWTELGWLRLECRAAVVEPTDESASERAIAIAALRAKYPQYAAQRLEDRPLLRFAVERLVRWGAALSGPGTGRPRAAEGSGSSSSPRDIHRR